MDGSASFAPTLLLAMPQLRDPNFVRSVVLLCEHGAQGALGFVVNRPTEVSRSAASSSSATTRASRTASGSPRAST